MVDLARTFVSFSSADKGRYGLMCAWKAHEHINFNLADFQLDEAINWKTRTTSSRCVRQKSAGPIRSSS